MNRPRLTVLLAMMSVAASIVSGCSLLHRNQETPQQKFVDALNRGNSVEASRIWIQMSQDDRNKLRRGEGVAPAVSPEQAMKILNQAQAKESETPVTLAPDLGAGLMRLPAIASPPPAEGAPVASPGASP